MGTFGCVEAHDTSLHCSAVEIVRRHGRLSRLFVGEAVCDRGALAWLSAVPGRSAGAEVQSASNCTEGWTIAECEPGEGGRTKESLTTFSPIVRKICRSNHVRRESLDRGLTVVEMVDPSFPQTAISSAMWEKRT